MVKIVKLPVHKILKSNLKILKLDPKDKVLDNRHLSVGAVIKNKNKYLIINRNLYPPGYASVAGHISKGETPEQGLIREVKEESNYDITSKKLLFHEIIHGNKCRTGFKIHEWYVYECKCKGQLKILRREEKSIGYKSKEQINKLYKQGKLEPIWGYWLKKLKIIK